MSVVGFDFGNSACKIAVARKRGIDVLQNEVGHRSTPAMVGYAGKQRFIGSEAVAQQQSNAKNTVFLLKRLLGKSYEDPALAEDRKIVPFKIVNQNDRVIIEVAYDDNTVQFSPEQITASLFVKLKTIAESGLENSKVSDCVISVPPSFNDFQRRAILDAAQIAGLNVLRLLNETTAVALQYGILRPLPKDAEQKVCFVDIGHSNTSVAVVGFTEGKLRVLSTSWDSNLGGRDFDEMLVAHFAKYIQDKYKMNPYNEVKAMLKLRKECERVKLMLTGNTKVPFNVEYLMNDKDVSGMIERPEFDALTQVSLIPRLLATIKSALDKAGVTKEQVNSVEVVGGTVRIPVIQKLLSDYFGKEVSKTCDGEESVARGCALMCAMISPSFKVKEFEVHDISPFPVELAWGSVPSSGEEFVADDSTPLFTAANAIPSVKLISFKDRSEPFMLVARYSDPATLPPGTKPLLGRFIVSGMPPRNADPNIKPDIIKVRVKLDIHGVIQVSGAQLLEEIPETPAANTANPSSTPAPAPAASTTNKVESDDMDEDNKPKEDAKPAANDKPVDKDKMDTEKPADAANAGANPSSTGAAAAPGPEPKKIKVRRVDLKVESTYFGGLPSTVVQSFFEKEAAMIQTDRIIHETNAARNDLEGHILDMRNRLSDDLAEFVREAEKEKINSALNAAEDWLYNDGSDAQKSEYKRKVDELKANSQPLLSRFHEFSNRSVAISNLKNSIQQYLNWANNTKDEKYSHIDANERKQVADEANKLEAWLNGAVNELSKLNKSDDPKITISALNAKKAELEKFSNPIINRPKPAPPKPQPQPANTANPTSTPTDNKSSTPENKDGSQPTENKPAESASNNDSKMETEK